MLSKQLSTRLFIIMVFLFSISTIFTEQIHAQYSSDSDTAGCCIFVRGNIDNDTNDNIDITDLVSIVDLIFSGIIYEISPIKCTKETDVNGNGSIDISDLIALVDIIFLNGDRPPYCNPDIALNVDTRIKISMQEESDDAGTNLLIGYTSEVGTPTYCYTIYTTLNRSENNFIIHFDSLTEDNVSCFMVPGYATGSDNLGQLPNGTYSLTLDNGSPAPFQLFVTDEYYKITGYDERQFIVETPILNKTL